MPQSLIYDGIEAKQGLLCLQVRKAVLHADADGEVLQPSDHLQATLPKN